MQTLALVVVTSGKLNGNRVLTVEQLYLVALVEGLWQDDVTIVVDTRQDFLLTHEQLGQHDARQRGLLVFVAVAYPVDTIESTKQYLTILLGQDGTHIELVALQTVSNGVVVQTIVEGLVFMVTLHDDADNTITCRYPDAVVLILGNTADRVVAETVFLRNQTEFVVCGVQNVDTLTRTYPQQSSGVFVDLCDIVVRKRLHV